MGRAIVVEQAVGSVQADDHVRAKALDFAFQPAGFRFGAGRIAREAARVAGCLIAPVALCAVAPVGGGEIAIQVDTVGVNPAGGGGQQAIRDDTFSLPEIISFYVINDGIIVFETRFARASKKLVKAAVS